ncbi:hypothetical protein G7Y79_00003g011140 [Physcia stellaris]|nr:hypothetical protein G7Y79_00003g011140 [Physcia stellaris]
MESAVVNCPLTAPPTPPHTPVRKHQEPHIQKSYLTMDDLHRMFAGKSRPYGPRQHQNRYRSPQGFGLRQPGRPCSTPSKKPYLTIENLSRMFSGNLRRKNLLYSQKSLLEGQMGVFSRGIPPGQMRIASYFKLTANQKSSISRDSKSSKPKSLNQHMPAEPIRTASSENLPEKSADLPCKLPDVSCHLKPSNPNRAAEAVFFISIFLRLLPALLLALAIVSAMSAAAMGCINAYGQAISAIGRAIQYE